jgi:hypothetical protein
MAMRYKCNLVTCSETVSDKYEGWYGEKFKRDNGWRPITDTGSRVRKAVTYERDVRDCK